MLAEYEQAWRDGRENCKQHRRHRDFTSHQAADLMRWPRGDRPERRNVDCDRRGRRTVGVGTRQGISPT